MLAKIIVTGVYTAEAPVRVNRDLCQWLMENTYFSYFLVWVVPEGTVKITTSRYAFSLFASMI